jgi:hypothetical protein
MKVFSSYVAAVFLFLGACTAAPESEVHIVLGQASQSLVSTSSEDAFAPRSSTGLVSTGFCYVLNVTAPDLNVEGTSNNNACAQGPRGLGKIFGPFAYGAETTLKVPAGADRRFDLLGFKAPPSTRQDCKGVMIIRAIDAGSGSKKVEMSYDGVPMGASVTPLDPERLSFLFARASSVSLQPGVQTVTLESVDWFEQNLGQGLKNYPTTYACPESGQAGVGSEKVSLLWSYLVGSPTLSVAQGATAQIQLQLKDVNGNTVSGISSTRLSLDGLMGVGSVSAFTSVGDGLYQANLTILATATVSATRSLVAKIDGQSFINSTRTLTVLNAAPVVDASMSTISLSDSFPTAGDELAVQVQLKDQNNNPVSGRSPQLRVEVGGSWDSTFGVVGTWSEGPAGTYHSTYHPLKAGQHEMHIDVDARTLVQVPILTVSIGTADTVIATGLPSLLMTETLANIAIETKKNGYPIETVTPSFNFESLGSTANLVSPQLTQVGVGRWNLSFQMSGRGDFSLMFGGNGGNNTSELLLSRAVMQTGYDPLSQDWNPIDPSYDVPVMGHTAIWAESEMIVWGGVNTQSNAAFPGLRYRPSEDRWIPMSLPPGGFDSRMLHTAVWTGSEMIVWGGVTLFDGYPRNDGAAYNPSNDTWTLLEVDIATGARGRHTAIWTGSKMIIWGGDDNGGNYWADGYAYDPSAPSGTKWQPIQAFGQPSARITKAVWTGTQMLIWGGFNTNGDLDDGAAYDPSSDTWETRQSMNLPLSAHSLVWTGTDVLRVGGLSSASPVNGAAMYRSAAGLWDYSVPVFPLGPVSDHTAILAPTGSGYVLVWGGQNNGSFYNTGYVYSLATPGWAWEIGPDLPNSPSARVGHTAIWTQGAGTRMIIWGGTPP